MGFLEILLLGVGLSFDAFAVSLTLGFAGGRSTGHQKARYIVVVGGFHVFMIVAGWFAGENFSRFIFEYDHWIAFVLLAGIGLHMIYEGIHPKKGGESASLDMLSLVKTLGFGLALSIDALISGFTLGMVSVTLVDGGVFPNILLAALIIGLCASVISFTAIQIGKKGSLLLGRRAEIFGGAILIFIGLKILIQHLCSA